jgi:hypothetical protein
VLDIHSVLLITAFFLEAEKKQHIFVTIPWKTHMEHKEKSGELAIKSALLGILEMFGVLLRVSLTHLSKQYSNSWNASWPSSIHRPKWARRERDASHSMPSKRAYSCGLTRFSDKNPTLRRAGLPRSGSGRTRSTGVSCSAWSGAGQGPDLLTQSWWQDHPEMNNFMMKYSELGV